MNKYTKEVRNIITTGLPEGVIVDVVDYGAHLGLRIYRDNLNAFPDYKQQHIYQWLDTTLNLVNQKAPCILEVESTPPNLRGKK